MKNNEKYPSLNERIEAFNEYCNSQPSCPCEFHNEHCELKWLDSETNTHDGDSEVYITEPIDRDHVYELNFNAEIFKGDL